VANEHELVGLDYWYSFVEVVVEEGLIGLSCCLLLVNQKWLKWCFLFTQMKIKNSDDERTIFSIFWSESLIWKGWFCVWEVEVKGREVWN